MAATLEGTFKLIDKATPALKSIRSQALQTDAALEKLGMTMDGLSKRQRLRNLENLGGRMRNVATESENVGRRADTAATKLTNLDRRTQSTHRSFAQLKRGLKDVASEMLKVGMVAGKFIGMGAAVGVAAQAISALGGGVIGLLPRIGDLAGLVGPLGVGIVGMGTAAITAKLAFGGLSQAMSGNKAAMRALTPEGRHLVRELRQMRPVFKDLKRDAQSGIFPALLKGLSAFRAQAPLIGSILKDMSGRIGSIIKEASRRFLNRGFLSDFKLIEQAGGRTLQRGASSLMNVAMGFKEILLAARPLTDWLSKLVVGWTKHWAQTMRAKREGGLLAAWFDRTKKSLEVLGRFVGAAWRAFKLLYDAARPLGNILWASATRGLEAWTKLHGTVAGRQGLIRAFLSFAPAIKSIFRLAGDLLKALAQMGTSGSLSRTTENLRKIVPPLQKLLTNLADKLGPALANTIAAFADLANTVSEGVGPFKVVLDVLQLLFKALNAIVGLGGPTKQIFTAIFSTLLISRYLVKLGLLQKGWMGVAWAAKEASIAEGGALAAGSVPGGILGPRGRAAGGFFGGIRNIFRGPGGGGAVAEAEQLVLPGMEAGAARAGLGSRLAGRVGLGGLTARAGIGGGLARVGLAAGSKVILPLAGIMAGIGALTAGRSGSVGHQAAQTAYGAVSGATGGLTNLIPGVKNFFATPEQRAQARASKDQAALQRDLTAGPKAQGDIARLSFEIGVLGQHSRDVTDRSTEASKAYLESINQEIGARREMLQQLKEERHARALTQERALERAANRALPGAIRRYGPVRGREMVADRALSAALRGGGKEQQNMTLTRLLRQGYDLAQKDPSLKPYYQHVVQQATRLGVPSVHEGRRFGMPGQMEEVLRARNKPRDIFEQSMHPLGRRGSLEQQGFTPAERALIFELIAEGMPGPAARAYVRQRHGKRAGKEATAFAQQLQRDPGAAVQQFLAKLYAALPKPPAREPGESKFDWLTRVQKASKRAGGGRIGGSGLQDTVPVGGAMAAPGELVVNRHQERAANQRLAKSGTSLDQIVRGMATTHAMAEPTKSGILPGLAGGGRLPSSYVTRAKNIADKIAAQHYPYTWGGGHNEAATPSKSIGLSPGGNWYPGIGYDCSGSVRAVLKGAGSDIPVMASGGFSSWGEAGPGKITTYSTPQHVFMTIDGKAWGTSGSKGPGWITPTPNTEGFTKRHPGAGGNGGGGGGGGGGGADGGGGTFNPLGISNVASVLPPGIDASGLGGIPFRTNPGGGGGAPSGAAPSSAARTPVLEGEMGPFAKRLAKATGLSPAVAAAWVRAEGDGGGAHNWLNVSLGPGGKSYSGAPASKGKGQFAAFPNIGASLTETAYWITSMSNYAGIRKAIAGGDADAQIAAIKASPWDAGHYAQGNLHLAGGGRVPKWGGWYARGGSFETSGPTLFGAGERGKEKVTITPTGGGAGGPLVHVENLTVHADGDKAGSVRREVELALNTFADALSRHPATTAGDGPAASGGV